MTRRWWLARQMALWAWDELLDGEVAHALDLLWFSARVAVWGCP